MTLVLDASVVAEYLIGSDGGVRTRALIARHGGDVHVPQHAVAETMSVLRGWDLGRHVPTARLAAAVMDLAEIPALQWPIDHLLERVWGLRSNISSYDAGYVALAEALDATLVTGDHRLARTVRKVATCPVVELTTDTGR